MVTTGALNPPTGWLLASGFLRGGASSGTKGNCLQQLGSGTAISVEICPGGYNLFSEAPHGGVFAFNNDGGLTAGGVTRLIPGCIIEAASLTTAPSVVGVNSTFNVHVDDYTGGGRSCALFMSYGSLVTQQSGIAGYFLLDPATTATIGFSTTPASFSITVPANTGLVGLQLTAQGLLLSGSGAPRSSMPCMISVR